MPDENPAGNCCTATHCSSPVQSVIGRCACVQETAAAMVATKNEPPQEQEEDDQVVVLTEMVVPPDGGWGWVIVFASFFCNLFIDGIIFSFGMFLNEIADAFQCTKAEVSIVGSLLTGFYLIVGPFVSALANRFGFRAVAMLGSALGCIGFGLSFYATNLMFLYITFGVIGGIGFGLVYVPAVIAVGFYFERWRALATGIGVCGSGIGTFVLAPLVAMMIPTYGWRGTVLILAGLILNCAVFGALFRPLAPIKVVVSKQEVEEQAATVEALQEKVTMNGNGTVGHEDIPLLMRIKIARDEMRKSDSLTSVRLVNEPSSPNMKNGHLRMNNNNYNNNNTYPTVVQVLARSTQSLKTIKENGSNGAPCNGSGLFGTTGNISQKEEEAHMNDENHLQITVRRSARIRTTSECSQGSCRKRAHTMGAKDLGVRPLYRDDIFFSASLLRLPQYKSQVSSVGYHLSVSRLPSKKDVEEEENPRCTVCPEAIKRTLTTMLDLSLLRSPTFLLLSISGFITIMGLYVPFIYLTDMAKLNGLPGPTAIWLISAIGVANTIGRVACGVVSSIPGTDVILMNNVALTIGGFMTMFATLSTNPIFLFTYCTIFGLSIACFASLRSIIIVEMMGLPKLTNAFGLMLMFQGVAAMIGSPLAGMVLEATGSYDWSFYLAGGLIAISGIICFPMKRLKAWEVQQEKKLRQQNIAV